MAIVNNFVLTLNRPVVFGEMRLAGLSFHMELLAKLSFQETARQGDTGGANQRIPGSAGKGMVPLLAKLWFKSHSSSSTTNYY
jgi:hypothetical protein